MEKTKTTNIHAGHRQRMKSTYLEFGLSAFSEVEALEFLLFYALGQKDTNPIAHRLLKEFGGLDKVMEASVEELKAVEGMGEHSAILIHLILEMAGAYGKSHAASKINGTVDAKAYALNMFKGRYIEEFYVVCLSTGNRVVATKLLARGTRSEVEVSIRQMTDIALKSHCERILLLHNHPDGPCFPSDEDVSFTAKILCSCLINNIEVLDHIIVSQEDQAFSFEESGMLGQLKGSISGKLPGPFSLQFPISDSILKDVANEAKGQPKKWAATKKSKTKQK